MYRKLFNWKAYLWVMVVIMALSAVQTLEEGWKW